MADENEVGLAGRAWESIQRMAKRCSANLELEETKAAVQLAQDRVGKVLMGGKLLQKDSTIFNKLTEANKGLAAMGEALENVQNLCNNIIAADKVLKAVDFLMDEKLINENPDKAAEMFDLIFQGFGLICAELPPPAKQWAKFFENFNLFSNMQKNVFKPYWQKRYDALNQRGVYSESGR